MDQRKDDYPIDIDKDMDSLYIDITATLTREIQSNYNLTSQDIDKIANFACDILKKNHEHR